VVQCGAVWCSVVQCVAVQIMVQRKRSVPLKSVMCYRVLQCVDFHGVVQCVAVRCSVLHGAFLKEYLHCVAVYYRCCSALQCVAVYCSVLQCIVVCCSVLRCVGR